MPLGEACCRSSDGHHQVVLASGKEGMKVIDERSFFLVVGETSRDE